MFNKIEGKPFLKFEETPYKWSNIKNNSEIYINYHLAYYLEDEYLWEESDKKEENYIKENQNTYANKFNNGLQKVFRKNILEIYGVYTNKRHTTCFSKNIDRKQFESFEVIHLEEFTKEDIQKEIERIKNLERFYQLTTIIDFDK